jgi:hypothetical protein
MNKYGSIERTFWARNIYQGALPAAIPADLVIAQADWHTQLSVNKYYGLDPVSINTNVMLKQVGLFCNFSDGLVFKSYKDVIDLQISSFVANPVVPAKTGTLICSPASRTVTGSGFAALLPRQIINVPFIGFFIVESIVNDGQAVLTDFPKYTLLIGAPGAWTAWAAAGPTNTIYPDDIRILNTFLPYENSISPVPYSAAVATSQLMIQIDVKTNSSPLQDAHDVTFETITIDTAFNSAPCAFDVGLVLELTV